MKNHDEVKEIADLIEGSMYRVFFSALPEEYVQVLTDPKSGEVIDLPMFFPTKVRDGIQCLLLDGVDVLDAATYKILRDSFAIFVTECFMHGLKDLANNHTDRVKKLLSFAKESANKSKNEAKNGDN